MKWSDFEHYLKGEHLQGKKPIVTITEITIEETHAQAGRAEQKPVAYFQGSKKGLILSPTNQRALRALFGDDVQDAIGKRVQLEAVSMRVGGRDTLPIRINAAPQLPPNKPAKLAAGGAEAATADPDPGPDPADFDDLAPNAHSAHA